MGFKIFCKPTPRSWLQIVCVCECLCVVTEAHQIVNNAFAIDKHTTLYLTMETVELDALSGPFLVEEYILAASSSSVMTHMAIVLLHRIEYLCSTGEPSK